VAVPWAHGQMNTSCAPFNLSVDETTAATQLYEASLKSFWFHAIETPITYKAERQGRKGKMGRSRYWSGRSDQRAHFEAKT
jgi:hypothetical protein